MKRAYLLLPMVLLVLAGAGCDRLKELVSPGSGTASPLSALSPEDAADRLQFMPGDSFEVRQTLFGLGAILPDILKSKDGVRAVTIDRFAPLYTADVSWQLSVERESAASKKAREDYLAHPSSTAMPPPVAVEKTIASGTLRQIDLRASHSLLPPAYWQDGDKTAVNEKSGLWISDDVYQELTRTGVSVVNIDLFSESASRVVKNLNDLKSVMDKWRNQAQVEQGKELDLMTADSTSTPVIWPVKVNGAAVKVAALKASNWFGDIIVLRNKQNPLILKLTVNPVVAGAANLTGAVKDLQNLFGYEIANLNIAAVK